MIVASDEIPLPVSRGSISAERLFAASDWEICLCGTINFVVMYRALNRIIAPTMIENMNAKDISNAFLSLKTVRSAILFPFYAHMSLIKPLFQHHAHLSFNVFNAVRIFIIAPAIIYCFCYVYMLNYLCSHAARIFSRIEKHVSFERIVLDFINNLLAINRGRRISPLPPIQHAIFIPSCCNVCKAYIFYS